MAKKGKRRVPKGKPKQNKRKKKTGDIK